MATSILITGASGLIGARLTEILLEKGYRVAHLGRSKKSGGVPSYIWDVEKGEIDLKSLEGADAIIHLAGAGVAEKRWTHQRKQEILESRTKSAALLYESLKDTKHNVKVVVSASAIGYYGGGRGIEVVNEESKPGNDYLATVVVDWEKALDRISSLGMRVAKIRIGIVLSEKGGALKEMASPIKWGVGAPLGTGEQMVSWIHLDDLSNLFIKAVEDASMVGAFNGVSPHPVTNREMTKAIAKVLKRPLFLPAIPTFVLKIMIGEMADIVVTGSNVSSEKIQRSGFKFKFTDLDNTLRSLFKVAQPSGPR